ncbi:FusB/FusC family EF-G-binding protein [Alkalihalophilus pseudofirmus]|uniref:FusB/FusC family EF-G-binding protein n=1 Tax=Alkalihalophilus pseudofirmus TaxID=79885 RepID=A0AAJ2NLP2_ALKPS|nr:FusB/FusC family EF-G-binding protein [Alkalihalophilus pseudofirmus]MDV2884568.1 FusB/FusC family EF-G-binding protein [Alkalihalophilus pseudofirmus]
MDKLRSKYDVVEMIVPFLRSDQYNFIRYQIGTLVHAHTTVKDAGVLHALKGNALDKITEMLKDATPGQLELLEQVITAEDFANAEFELRELKRYVIPFPHLTDKTIAKLFPKAKKLKAPSLDEVDYRELSYFGWYDIRSERKFLIVRDQEVLKGIQGTFTESKKGICSICNGHEELGLFMANVKTSQEQYTNRGNYICKDSEKCNRNMTSLDKLETFIDLYRV